MLTRAVREAALAGSPFLVLDALHMLALNDEGHEEEWAAEGFDVLAGSRDPRVLRWGVALHNNLGWTMHDGGRAEAALAQFQQAVEAADLLRHGRAAARRPLVGRPMPAHARPHRRGARPAARARPRASRRPVRAGGARRADGGGAYDRGMTAEGADAAGTGRFTLDTPPLGRARRAHGAGRASGRSATARWATSSATTRAGTPSAASSRRSPSLPLDENVTIVAEVLEVRERTMRSRRGSILEAKISDGTGILTLTFFNQAWRARELRARRARHLRRQGRRLPRARASSRTPTTSCSTTRRRIAADAAAAKRWAEAPIPIYPATGTLASWQLAKSIALLLDGLGDVDDPVPDAVRAGAVAARPAARARGDPPARGRGRLEVGAAHAAVHRGVRAADGAAAAARRAARAHDDRAASVGRAGSSSASTRRCRSRSPPTSRRSAPRSPTTSSTRCR